VFCLFELRAGFSISIPHISGVIECEFSNQNQRQLSQPNKCTHAVKIRSHMSKIDGVGQTNASKTFEVSRCDGMMRISIEFGATNPQRYLKAIECRDRYVQKRQKDFSPKAGREQSKSGEVLKSIFARV